MGGGLMQLVAYGAQDIYLTGNPQITFFKVLTEDTLTSQWNQYNKLLLAQFQWETQLQQLSQETVILFQECMLFSALLQVAV